VAALQTTSAARQVWDAKLGQRGVTVRGDRSLPHPRTGGHVVWRVERHHNFRSRSAAAQSSSADLVAGRATLQKSGSVACGGMIWLVLGAFSNQAHNLILLSEDEARMLGRLVVEPEHLLLA
jgi:hypothetical protein